MSSEHELGNTARQIFNNEEVDGVLNGSFYGSAPSSAVSSSSAKEKPTHYKVICISMYIDALERLDGMVKELKSRGYTKANRSALIRHALNVVDLDQVPRGI